MKPVLVTTEYRGVFFGYVEGELKADENREMTLSNARNCLYWSSDCKGFLGLASSGPTEACRVGPQVQFLTLYGVTSIAPVNAEAVKKWEEAPWK